MKRHDPIRPDTEQSKRTPLMVALILAWLGTLIAWALFEWRGVSSIALRTVLGANIVFHPVMFAIVRRRLLSQRVIDITCLVFVAVICAGCMVLKLYFPEVGATIDLRPLYLWIPIIYVMAFMLTSHRTGLIVSLSVQVLLFAISLPYLIHHPERPEGNFTIQLHIVSAVLVAALYFFSSYQQRLQIAQLTVDELGQLANTDVLTCLPNRRRLAEILEFELVRFARYGRAFALIMIDVDHFKSINDRFGHKVGDHVLVALAARAGEALRDVDTLGRWGGEEFVVILPETDAADGLRKAEALCTHVAAQPLIGEHAITISCGVASVAPSDTAESLLKRADVALYAAKQQGRNRAEHAILAAASSG
ncbi:hypothetical protein RHOFW510R12_16315 [Rhodanobacter sp. FW510-R12]|uniref:GGDEF domain-containing protein n=1 Tax=Rhodanobacter TaxID=75309 RepID=UPI00042363CB|nr:MULTISPECIES: GGDEF domain-containing protein [Rhodanobacter]TAN16499.1 MAG: GGDEF domain-containing protein [Rhodanobacter sp.]UJJ54524.1 GGDEF domain-containing protein [Rhodanobacter thiooxydans]